MRATAAFPLLLLYCAPSSALSVHELQQQCAADPTYCLGYIQGVLDDRKSWRYAYELDPAHPAKSKFRSMTKDNPAHPTDAEDLSPPTGKNSQARELPWVPRHYCIPPHETLSQLKEIVLRHFADHPAAFDDPADVAIATALDAAFPCTE